MCKHHNNTEDQVSDIYCYNSASVTKAFLDMIGTLILNEKYEYMVKTIETWPLQDLTSVKQLENVTRR